MKPLGGKAYGSIPHLPGSRLGVGDHHCHVGQEVICTTKARDKHDRIIVTEKLDGACVSVARINGEIVPLIRAGYTALSAHYEHLRLFHVWAMQNYARFDNLPNGYRICGEWIALAHGTIYKTPLESPFVPFDLIGPKGRLPHDAMASFCKTVGLRNAHVVHDGTPITVDAALAAAGEFGHHGALETIEGLVWRVERNGEYDFNAKFVRPDKKDGKYLTEIGDCQPIWLWRAPDGSAPIPERLSQ